jgi:REP-associated tyrosine transposase
MSERDRCRRPGGSKGHFRGALPAGTIDGVPRAPRPQVEGGIYHLTARGVRRLPLFVDDEDRLTYTALLSQVVARFGWLVHLYCLMPNHVHLLVETPHGNVSRAVQWFHGRYAEHVNQRHAHEGHVFDRRFHSVLVERDPHLLEAVRYIAMNPVRAAICAEPEWFPWSSYRELVGLSPPTCTSLDLILGCFADEPDSARARLAEFVRDAS